MEDKICPILTVAQATLLIPWAMQQAAIPDIGQAWAGCEGEDCAMYEHCSPLSLRPDDDLETDAYIESKETACGASEEG